MKRRLAVLTAAEWSVAIAATLASIGLQFHWMRHAGGLWRDEVGSANFAAFPTLREIWSNLAYDNFPPLLLLPLRIWSRWIGPSDESLRWFGFAMGMASLATVWIVARWTKARVPLVALTLVALSPLAIRTLDAIRPYGLGVLLLGLVFGCFWKLVEKPTLRNFVFAALAATLSVQCLYQNAAFIFALACASAMTVLMGNNWRVLPAVAGAGFVAAMSLLVHLPHLRAARDWGVVAQGPVSISYLIGMAASALRESGQTAMVATVLAVLALLAWLVTARRQQPESRPGKEAWFGGAAIIAAILGYGILLLSSHLPTQPWYYIILILFTSLALDLAFGNGMEIARWGRLSLALAVGITTLGPAWKGTAIRQTNIDLLASQVETLAEKDDYIIVNPWYCGLTWQRYYHGSASWTTMPPLPDLRIHRYDLLKQQMTRPDQSKVLAPVLEHLRTTLEGGHQVWLVGGLPLPPSGESVQPLPPAPASPAGWSGEIYGETWGMETAEFLRDHVTQVEQVSIEQKGPTNVFENLPIIKLQGWH